MQRSRRGRGDRPPVLHLKELCRASSRGEGAAIDDLDAGGAFEPVVEEFGGAAPLEVGDDAGVEGDGVAGAYARAPLSFVKPEVVCNLCAGLRVPDVDQYDAAAASVAPS